LWLSAGDGVLGVIVLGLVVVVVVVVDCGLRVVNTGVAVVVVYLAGFACFARAIGTGLVRPFLFDTCTCGVLHIYLFRLFSVLV